MSKNDGYLWIDLETTGLRPHSHSILEVSAIWTDLDFDEIDRYSAVVACEDRTWSHYCVQMHNKNGLIQDLQRPGGTQPLCVIEREIMNRCAPFHDLMIAGKSVHFDRGFIRCHMQSLDQRLSHRHFDVSVLRMMWPGFPIPKQVGTAHRAEADNEHALAIARAFRSW